MSVYSAGAASVRRRDRAGGSLDDDTPATNKWRDQMRAAAAAVRTKYAGAGPFQVAAVLADVEHWWQIATQFANEASSLKAMRPDRLKQAKDNALNLLEVRAELRMRVPTALSITGDEAHRIAEFMAAPIDWLVAVGENVLAAAETPASWIKKALWIGGAIAGVWAITKLLDSGVAAKRELVGARPLIAPRGLVRNPPAWAADPELWETARTAVEESGPFENAEHVKIHVYKQLGGRVS